MNSYPYLTRAICVIIAAVALLGSANLVHATPPNVLLICVDDLRPELACYGKDYIHSPNIDKLASEGCLFERHFVQAPTCGASRFAMLTGNYGGASNGALFQRAKAIADGKTVSESMPAWFRGRGYRTVSVGKVSHHPGGRGGSDWDDPAQPEMPNSWDEHLNPSGDWLHPRGSMHGLAHGEIRGKASEMDLFQSAEGNDSIYPDGLTTELALEKIESLAAEQQPFFLAVGLLKPHLPFGAPAQYVKHYADATLPPIAHPTKPSGKTTWHRSGEFMKYNRWNRDPNLDAEFAILVRKHYAACVTYSDALIGRLIAGLKKTGEYENTVIVVWGDHGWHLGEHAIWGKHALFEESLHSPLIIRSPKVAAGRRVQTIAESVDIFPTLCSLTGIDMPQVTGQSLASVIVPGDDTSVTSPLDPLAVSYTGSAKTIRSAEHRLILHKDNFAELYAHPSDSTQVSYSAKNIASTHPEIVESLTQALNQRLGR
ncbi:MAG: sulfatase [Aureliella sp.]